ncbi:Hypothetical predicted protein [Prunus dulcis]|uniref:Transposable element protein n=1 Tax=Prunus dulcis TaxID=3755 RepID=A0A5E4F9W4_PRUDU|nr:hypothetical protein L3X38_040834 [Prunus dulcis]VVA24745.1 Hypothetical predicted protein [Prunus dulcis]
MEQSGSKTSHAEKPEKLKGTDFKRRFLDFKMVDSKPVVKQVEDLQKIIHEILAEGMKINESFQVAFLIEKLPQNWKEFKSYLKHKRKEMSMEDLIIRLRIKEDN